MHNNPFLSLEHIVSHIYLYLPNVKTGYGAEPCTGNGVLNGKICVVWPDCSYPCTS